LLDTEILGVGDLLRIFGSCGTRRSHVLGQQRQADDHELDRRVAGGREGVVDRVPAQVQVGERARAAASLARSR
jgi:hypothetical protein